MPASPDVQVSGFLKGEYSYMNILVLAPHYPFFDRSSGDFRLFQILRALSQNNKVFYCGLNNQYHAQRLGMDEIQRYERHLDEIGVVPVRGGPSQVLKQQVIDAVFCEFYFVVASWIKSIRLLQPHARVIVDSVDVHYHRLNAKAKLTGSLDDAVKAATVKEDELAAYRLADVVITVTDRDRELLINEIPGLIAAVVPNIHPIHEPVLYSAKPTLIFIGGFAHEPNIDAMLYFCSEVFARIIREIPEVRLTIIGSEPPDVIQKLVSKNIEVLGYVPDITSYLESALISIAPLRFGAGMKGKIGEAMSFGLPVVTTRIGIEGFGLTHGKNVLVGDSPQEFSDAVLSLLKDKEMYERIRLAGYHYIKQNYSEEAVQTKIFSLFDGLNNCPVSRISFLTRVRMKGTMWIEQNLLWRLPRK